MKLTTDVIKQLIKEELDSMSSQQKLLQLIEDGQWSVAMELASALGFLDDEGFANNIINAIISRLNKEAQTINFGRDNEFVAQRKGTGIEMYVRNFENGMIGMKSSLTIENDGSLSFRSFAAPEVGKGMAFYTLDSKEYTARGLTLAEVLEKINIIYSFGWETRKNK